MSKVLDINIKYLTVIIIKDIWWASPMGKEIFDNLSQ